MYSSLKSPRKIPKSRKKSQTEQPREIILSSTPVDDVSLVTGFLQFVFGSVFKIEMRVLK